MDATNGDEIAILLEGKVNRKVCLSIIDVKEDRLVEF